MKRMYWLLFVEVVNAAGACGSSSTSPASLHLDSQLAMTISIKETCPSVIEIILSKLDGGPGVRNSSFLDEFWV